MIQVDTREQLDQLAGRPPAAPIAQTPAPAAAPSPAVDSAAMTEMRAAITTMATSVAQAAQIAASIQQQPIPAPRKLTALVHRDVHGRMERIDITVVQQEQ